MFELGPNALFEFPPKDDDCEKTPELFTPEAPNADPELPPNPEPPNAEPLVPAPFIPAGEPAGVAPGMLPPPMLKPAPSVTPGSP